MRLPHIGPRAFLRLSQASAVLVVLNIVSGAAVRLTDSGLGCPDWPTCSGRSVTPALSFHPMVEFGNRMVVVALSVVVGATLVGALVRRPVRNDLRWLSGGLLGGVFAEALLGYLVVHSKLNPYAVMTHFMTGIGLLSVALVLALRAGRAAGPGRPAVDRSRRGLAWAFLAGLVMALCAGTATTGSGPHAGGPGAVRLPVPLDDMARTHSGLVLVSAALLLLELWMLHRAQAPEGTQERGRLLLAAVVAQGAIGYLQFFMHLPALLVGIHVLGASVVWSAAVWFVDGLYAHTPDAVAAEAPDTGTPPPAVRRIGTVAATR